MSLKQEHLMGSLFSCQLLHITYTSEYVLLTQNTVPMFMVMKEHDIQYYQVIVGFGLFMGFVEKK